MESGFTIHIWSLQELLWYMNLSPPRILLIDLDDSRRASRALILLSAGYEVDVRLNWQSAESVHDVEEYDLVLLAGTELPEAAIEYGSSVRGRLVSPPILFLTDQGIDCNREAQTIRARDPVALVREVARLLTGSDHVRGLPTRT